MDNTHMPDHELDQLLGLATTPVLPEGFAQRLQAKLEASPTATIIAFPQSSRKPKRLWLSAIPLAASLAAGLYLGAVGAVPDSLSALAAGGVAAVDDAQMNVGIEDTELFLDGGLS